MQALRIVTPATEQQKQFYSKLFNNFDRYIEIRLIDSNGTLTGQHFLTIDELMNYKTPNNVNVYVGIYERGVKRGTIDSCTKTNAIYLDFDDMELDEIMFRIDTSNAPQPTMIISSGNGYHVYWTLDKPAGKEIKPIIEKLASMLNADTRATDAARVLRIPNTYNVKGTPKPCEITTINDNVTTVKELELLTGVKAEHKTLVTVGNVKELAAIKVNGLNNMSTGVGKGERNFCTGRIVQTLKRLNYTKAETTDIIFKWNQLNQPKKQPKELKRDINTYWHDERYRYDGKEFTDDRLEELNQRFVDDETVYFIANNDSFHTYDNDLLGDDFHKISGLTFAILSIIKMGDNKGMTLKHIAELCRRDPRDKTLLSSIDFLFKRNHIDKKSRKGRATIYTFKDKPFSEQRGFTSVPKLLHKLYIESCNAKELEQHLNIRDKHKAYDRLNETRYKILILLESYAYDSKREVYPSNRTIADRMRLHTKTIKRNMDWLEHNQFIKTFKKEGKRFIRLNY